MLYKREFAAAVAIASENARPVTHARALAETYWRAQGALPYLVADADAGAWWAWWAWDALSLITQELLRVRELPPPLLADWAARVLETRGNRPPQPTGPDPYGNLTRNARMVRAAARLNDFGYKPITRPGDGPCCEEGGSVLDAVGVAHGGVLAYKSVEALWSTFSRCESGKGTPADRRLILGPDPLALP